MPQPALPAILRGAALTWAMVIGPLLIGIAAFRVGRSMRGDLEDYAFSLLVLWKTLVFPHGDLFYRNHGPVLGEYAAMVAGLQWTIVSLAVGWWTRDRPPLTQLAVGAAVVVLVGIASVVLASVLGVFVPPDMP